MQVVSINLKEIQIAFLPAQEQLFLGDLLKITDAQETGVIAQIYDIKSNETTPEYNTAYAQIMLSVADNEWMSWQGNSINSEFQIQPISSDELLNQFNVKPKDLIKIGSLSSYGSDFLLNKTKFNEPIVILSDTQEERVRLTNVLACELAAKDKVVLLDFKGEYKNIQTTRLKAGSDFKLPLDSKRIDSIYAKGLSDASTETRAVIEDIFMQVQQYANECEDGFIPFSSFKTVVDTEYMQSKVTELVLLKNGLSKYQEKGIFTDSPDEIISINVALQDNNLVIVDLSAIPLEWHKDYAEFIASFISMPYHLILEGSNQALDIEFINDLYTSGLENGIKPCIALTYDSQFAANILPFIKTLMMFKPVISKNILNMYDNYLSKLELNEFLFCSNATKYIPLFITTAERLTGVTSQDYSLEEFIHVPSKTPTTSLEENTNIQDIELETSESEEISYVEDDEYLDFYNEQTIITPEQQGVETISTQDVAQIEPAHDFIQEVEAATYISKPANNSESGYMELTEQNLDNETFQEEVIDYQNSDINFDEDELPEIQVDYAPQPATISKEPIVADEVSMDVDTLYSAEQVPSKTLPNQEIPIYPAGDVATSSSSVIAFEEGDMVRHKKYGTGLVKKIIGYGNKKLCSIQFEKVGRRLLDPDLASLEKI